MLLGKLLIDWTQMPTYNTIMAIAAGAGLCSIAHTMQNAGDKKQVRPRRIDSIWCHEFFYAHRPHRAHHGVAWPYKD